MLCFVNFFLFAAKYSITHFYDVFFIDMYYESHSFKKTRIEKHFDSLIYICFMLYDFNEK